MLLGLFLLLIIPLSQASTLTADQFQSSSTLQKNIIIKVVELKDNSGLVYLGGLVTAADLAPYLHQLEQLLQDDFSRYRENQAKRDHGLFHITLITPNEYQFIDKSSINLGQMLQVNLMGLGKVSSEDKKSYFVIAQSNDAQFYRQKRVLNAKDFHVTLGFNPQDVYNKQKNMTTLISQ
jgi:hypothetical protein